MATGQVKTEIQLLESFKDNTSQDIFPIDLRDFVATMFNAVASVSGADSYVYIAYADDASGTGFTNIFNATKDWIAIRSTNTAIPIPNVGDFVGLWKKYKGDQGDKGFSLLTGNVDPLVGDGVDGDTYLNLVSYELFGPKSGGIWGTGTSIEGNGISTVVLHNTVLDVDTYRMTFTNGSFFDYNITNSIVQNGINLGVGGSLFKQVNGSNHLEFRTLTTTTPNNIAYTENPNDLDITFSYEYTNNIATIIIPDLLVDSIEIKGFNHDKIFVYSGYLYQSSAPGSYGPTTVLANYSHTHSGIYYGMCPVFDGGNVFINTIGIMIKGGEIILQSAITLAIGDIISLDGITIFEV